MSNVFDTVIMNNRVSSGDDFGIFITHCERILVAGNTIYDCGSDGIYCGDSKHIIISNNFVFENGRYGIDLFRTNYSEVSNNIVYKNSQSSPGSYYAIRAAGTTDVTSIGVKIIGNIVYDDSNSQRGITYSYTDKVVIKDNILIGVVSPIMYGASVTNAIIANNQGYHFTSQFDFPISAPSSPQTGDAYFDPDTNTLYIYNGTAWVSTALT